MKNFNQLLIGLFFVLVIAMALHFSLAVPFALAFGITLAVAIAKTLMSAYLPKDIAQEALFADLWTGELLNHFRHDNLFLSRIPNGNSFVNKDAIHLADIGVDPNVLINNTTYPIPAAQRTDSDIVISLDKFDTENTIITDDEVYALPYDKEGSVIRQHREVLEERTAEKAIHSLCCLEGTGDTPVVFTSGASNGETYARKRCSFKDIAKLQLYMDNLKIPSSGRELVLSPYHAYDLMIEDDRFKTAWINLKEGEVLNIFGFMISKFVANPVFDSGSGQKKAFDAAVAEATDLATSVAYYNKRAVKATGSVTMYKSLAKDNPRTRQTEIGFRLHHICMPKKNVGFGAIVSDIVA